MQVTRRRQVKPPSRRLLLLTAAATVAVVTTGAGMAYGSTWQFGTGRVGEVTAKGLVVSSDQYVAPIGKRLVINNGKIMSSAVSPDGTHLAATITDGGM